jgi:anthranilate synthase component 1
MFSALASNFPAGTLSGAPKIESMKIIDSIEQEPRGPYGGAVGYFGFDGNCTFCIPIRSLFISNNHGFIQASGGIVYDSQADLEYQEIQNKLRPLDQVLKTFMEAK